MSTPQPSRHLSPWVHTAGSWPVAGSGLPHVSPDVLVVGAGIVGLTTALELQQAGRRVMVIDADGLSRSVTVRSTVKVTVGHGTLYSAIEAEHGLETAKTYADANVAGFQHIAERVRTLDIDCAFQAGQPHVVYAETDDERAMIDREADIAQQVGLSVRVLPDAPLPFDVPIALHFEDQAQFHPGRYVAGLAEAVLAGGGTLVEGVRALGVTEESDVCHVETTAGTVSADHVVAATQFPFLDRGGQFAWLKPTRTYGIAGVLPEGVPAGMTINVGSPTHSTRTAVLDGEQLLIVVGEGHAVGHDSPTGERWARLQGWATEHFGVSDFRYHWSAEETHTLDKLPMVGRISPVSQRVLTAAGFDGWGMTNGTAAAVMMRDLVLGEDNPWTATFDARRAESTIPGAEFIKHNVHIGKTWVKDRVGRADGTLEDLQPGDAGIVDVNGRKTAAYRDDAGTLHAVSPVCTHMACDVVWNDGERSWDCPCHGSRFSHDGQVLHGPATRPLEPRDI